MYLAHGPISYIANELIQKNRISKLSTHEKTVVLILSLLFGILPDIDLAILSMTSTPVFLHHKVFTHSITFYILLWVLLIIFFNILKRFLNKEGRKTLNDNLLCVIHYSFLIGTVTHLLSDSLFSSIVLLYPLKYEFNILGQVLKNNSFISFLYSPYFAIELLSISIFLKMIFQRYIHKFKVFKYPLYLLIFLSVLNLFFSTYMNLNTYNMGEYIQEGKEAVDIDYDGVQNINDMDVDNNGILNIFEYDPQKGKIFAQSISNNTFFATKLDSIWEEIKFKYGAFTSYRVISQTYLTQNLPLEPILMEYVKKRDVLQSYTLNYSYPTLLYEYAKDNGYINNELEEGRVFFIIENDNLLNMGIVIDQSYFVIVLQGDTRLIKHSKDEIESTYPKSIIRVLNTH